MKKIILVLTILVFVFQPVYAYEEINIPSPGLGESLSNEPVECEVNGWGWKEEYGYYEVNNNRANYLTVWYDPYEQSYSGKHPYSSMSCEHVKNGTIVYPINYAYTNEQGNTFLPFVIEYENLKYPEYENDGDGVYWLLLENFNGTKFLNHYD